MAYYGISATPGPNSIGQKGGYCLMAGCMGKYQAILLDNPNVTLQTTTTLKLATLIPDIEGDSAFQHTAWKSLTKFILTGQIYWTCCW